MAAFINSNAYGLPDMGLSITPANALFLPGSDQFAMAPAHSSHPKFGHLVLLVFEAVMEVVCVSLPGYIVARAGMFDANAQKFVANLNIILFTPCLIFSKLASQLSGDKLMELTIIPVILIVQTFVSWLCAVVIARLFKLNKKPEKNFVVAMAVFGNANSLPLSLVISLSKTISGLHWDKVPGDNDDEVAARGILYLLVFSQLGQALRWSWGMNTLLKPLEAYKPEERGDIPRDTEGGRRPYQDSPSSTRSNSLASIVSGKSIPDNQDGIVPAHVGPATSSSLTSDGGNQRHLTKDANGDVVVANGVRGNADLSQPQNITSDVKKWWQQAKLITSQEINKFTGRIHEKCSSIFRSLPPPLQKALTQTGHLIRTFWTRLLSCLNIPLIAIILSVVIATVPPLQRFFFTPGTFVNNSITRAISQSGGVAIPLILVVLGANLARNTLPDEDLDSTQHRRDETKMVIASLVCRMLLPTIIMAPLLAITAKYVPISILDDPIFIIVCFLLSGAPSALQLAQMCQVNGLYVRTVSRLLFHSYVIWILPSTLILVVMAVEVVEWATGS